MGDKEGQPVLTKFVEGKTSFLSTGISVIKMTVGGEEELVSLPIKSLDIVETREAFAESVPMPPEKEILVRKGSALGREMELERDTPMIALNAADAKYQKALRAHNQDLMWNTVAKALDCEFVTEAGETITDTARIVEILKASGISGHHLDQIMMDVNNLTKRVEARADFLSDSVSA